MFLIDSDIYILAYSIRLNCLLDEQFEQRFGKVLYLCCYGDFSHTVRFGLWLVHIKRNYWKDQL